MLDTGCLISHETLYRRESGFGTHAVLLHHVVVCTFSHAAKYAGLFPIPDSTGGTWIPLAVTDMIANGPREWVAQPVVLLSHV